MAKNVYPVPSGIVQSITYGPQHRVTAEQEFFGGWSQETEITPRVDVTLEGIFHQNNQAAFWAFLNRVAGGIGLAAIADFGMRKRIGADAIPAINSSGAELWIDGGGTSTYDGESIGATWRSVLVQAAGAASADAASIAVDGLLASETVKAGTPIRIGNYRYIVTADVTASSGAATLAIAPALRSDVSDNTDLRLPGDLAVCRLMESPKIGGTDTLGIASFSMSFREVYESQITGGFTWVV